MRTITLLLLCAIMHSANAQDFVIGGQAKPSAAGEKYDSLSNFFTLFPNQEPEKAKAMIGQEVTYYNTHDYSNGYYQIPYPWKDGRLRSGRYTSSQTAKDAYLAELKKKSGTKYKITDYVVYEGKPGYVFTDNNGESIFYTDVMFVDGEFVCEGYKEKFRKQFVGKDVYFTTEGMRQNWNPKNIDEVRHCFIGLQSRELKPTFPNMSKWTVKGLGVDTTYWGDHTIQNDMYNNFCRLVFVVHNDEMGDYECYVSMSDMLERGKPVGKPSPRFIIANTQSAKPTAWGKDISTQSWEGTIPSEVLATAKNGEPNALYAIINYYNDYGRFNIINNLSYDDYVALLNKAVDGGYIHHRTPQWLYKVATHYMPRVISQDKEGKNDYKKGIPVLMKAARLGDSDAINSLIEAIDQGKTNDNEAFKIIEEGAEKENAAKLFLGRQLLMGKKLSSPDKIVSMLQELGNTTYSGNDEAFLILSECYEKGIGVEKDGNKAFELLTKSADKNNQTACFLLGEKYYYGNGVVKDLDKSANYLQKGIRMERRSIRNIGFKYHYMLGKILASKADRDCISHFENAFSCNDPKRYEAAIDLGNLYYEGKLVDKNEGEAAEYYWLAYKDGKMEEGKRLFEQYQLKDKLINYLNEQKSEGNLTDDYVDEIIQSLNK